MLPGHREGSDKHGEAAQQEHCADQGTEPPEENGPEAHAEEKGKCSMLKKDAVASQKDCSY